MGNTIFQNTYPVDPPIGFNGQIVGPIEQCDIFTLKNVEVSASIAFGRAVVFKTASPASNLDALLPAAQADLVAGIVFHQHGYMPAFQTTDIDGNVVVNGEMDAVGLVPGTLMGVLRKGKILVVCEDGCAVGDRLFVRAISGAPPEFLGGLNNAADASDMIDCTKQAQWLTSATAGGLAILSVDFLNKP